MSNSLYKMFKTDEKNETGGIDLDYGAAGKIRIARAGGNNRKYRKLIDERLKPYRRQLRGGTMDDAVADRVIAEVYADSVIIGWEGVVDENGNALEYNRANVIKLLTDLPDLFKDIQEQAIEVSNFLQAELADDLGN